MKKGKMSEKLQKKSKKEYRQCDSFESNFKILLEFDVRTYQETIQPGPSDRETR